MGNNANMLVGTGAGGGDGTGLAWFAPFGSTAPTNQSSALDAAFLDAGLIAESGLTVSLAETSKKIKAYGTTVAQRTIVTDEETSFKLAFLEVNKVATAVYFRKALTAITPAAVTGAFTVTTGTHNTQFYAATFEIIDGNNKLRAYAPKVEVVNKDDFTVGNGNEIPWGVTLTAYPVSGVAISWFFVIPSLAP